MNSFLEASFGAADVAEPSPSGCAGEPALACAQGGPGHVRAAHARVCHRELVVLAGRGRPGAVQHRLQPHRHLVPHLPRTCAAPPLCCAALRCTVLSCAARTAPAAGGVRGWCACGAAPAQPAGVQLAGSGGLALRPASDRSQPCSRHVAGGLPMGRILLTKPSACCTAAAPDAPGHQPPRRSVQRGLAAGSRCARCAAASQMPQAIMSEEAMLEREVSRFGSGAGEGDDSAHPTSSHHLQSSLKKAAQVGMSAHTTSMQPVSKSSGRLVNLQRASPAGRARALTPGAG